MSPFSFLKRHPRGDLSAYIDGQMSPATVSRVESHLDSCKDCSTLVAELRVLRAALSESPQADAPRSFALTADQVRDARPSADPYAYRGSQQTPPLAVGMRLASVGVAAALAFVVLIDVGGVVEDDSGTNSSRDETSLDYAALASAAADGGVGAGAAGQAGEALPQPGEGALDIGATAPTEPTSKYGDDDASEAQAGGSVPTGEAADPHEAIVQNQAAPTGDSSAPPGQSTDTVADTLDSGNDSGSTLLIVEIALAVALVTVLMGSLVLARVRRP